MIRAHMWLGPVVIAALVACGGGGPTIDHQVPMEKLWHTPPEERDAVAAAYKQLQVVRAELAHARFLLEDTERQADIAKAERKRARHEARIAELQRDRREASFRTALVEQASQALTSHQDEENALKRKLRWLELREKYLKREVARLEAEAHATEARLELAKAELGVKSGAVTDQDLQAFQKQAQRAEGRLATRQQAAQSAREKSEAARNGWGGSE